MDAATFGRLKRPGRFVDVELAAARQRGDNRPKDFLARHSQRRFRVGGGRDRKSGLDDVDAERVERSRHCHLGRDVHREPGGLFAVAQGRVEDDNARGPIAHDVQL